MTRVMMGAMIRAIHACAIFAVFVSASIAWAEDDGMGRGHGQGQPRVVYPKQTELDFEGTQIEGEVRNPGEFYFQRRPEEKFDSLVKRRKNFHREMLRDVVLGK